MTRSLLRLAACIVMLSAPCLVSGCASPTGSGQSTEPTPPAAGDPSELVVGNAWIAMADEGSDPSLYFVIQNRGQTSRTLTGARSTRCESISIRQVVVDDGLVTSKRLREMEIPAGGAVAFVPRGLFLRLEAAELFEVGEEVPITLELTDGGSVSFEAEVRDP